MLRKCSPPFNVEEMKTEEECSGVVWLACPGRRSAILLKPHVNELLGPIDIARGSLQVYVIPIAPKIFGRRVRHGNLAACFIKKTEITCTP